MPTQESYYIWLVRSSYRGKLLQEVFLVYFPRTSYLTTSVPCPGGSPDSGLGISEFGRCFGLLLVWWWTKFPLWFTNYSASHLALVPACSPMVMILLGSKNILRIIKSVLRALSENGNENTVIWIKRDNCHHLGKGHSSGVCIGCSWESCREI